MNKLKIIYIGNQLSKHGTNQTTMEALIPMLEKEGIVVKAASNFKNKLVRMLHMVAIVCKNSNSNYVSINT